MSASVPAGDGITPLLREAYDKHRAKRAAHAADVPHETARSWLKGQSTPSAAVLLRMAARCDDFAAALERRLVAAREAREMARAQAAQARVDAAEAREMK